MFDYHIHSNFSADCTTEMEKTIEQAINIGLKEICFTDHIDYDYPDPSIEFEFDLADYDRKIRGMQEIYPDIQIKKGIEIGVQRHLLGKYEQLLVKETFDFIICSMHTTERKDLHSGAFFKGKSIDHAFQTYYEELLYCIREFKDFNVLGHLDLVKRYTKEKPKKDFHEIIEMIFKEIIDHGKGIELNTSGFRYGLGNGMPSIDILKLYKECGGEIITLGSDSHVETTLAYRFKEAAEILDAAGFAYVATFKNRKPIFHSIK